MIKKFKVYKNTIYTLLLRIIGAFTLLGFTIYFSNHYPAYTVGEYEFVRMFLLVVGGLCLVGTEVSILYFAGQLTKLNKFESIKPLYFSVLKLVIAISFIPLIVYYLVPAQWINDFFGNKNSAQWIAKCLFVLPFNVLTLFNTEMIRAIHHIVWSELFRNVIKFFPIFFGVFLYSSSENQQVVLDYYIYGFVLLAIVTLVYVLYYLKKISTKNASHIFSINEILKTSAPIAVSNLIMYLLLTIDVVLLRKWLGSEVAGLYSIPIKIVLFLNMIILSINVNVSPKIAEMYQDKKEELQSLLRKNARFIASLNFAVGLVILLFPDWILGIFGNSYTVGKSALYLLVLGHLTCSLFGCVAVYLNMTNRSSVFRKIMFFSLVINMMFNLLLIPKYGMQGAAISFVAANLFWNIIASIYIYTKDKIKIFLH